MKNIINNEITKEAIEEWNNHWVQIENSIYGRNNVYILGDLFAEIKELAKINKTPLWYYISSYNHRNNPTMDEIGSTTYARSELYSAAKELGFVIYKLNNDIYFVFKYDHIIIDFLKASGYEKEDR